MSTDVSNEPSHGALPENSFGHKLRAHLLALLRVDDEEAGQAVRMNAAGMVVPPICKVAAAQYDINSVGFAKSNSSAQSDPRLGISHGPQQC